MKDIVVKIKQLLPTSILTERIRNQYGERTFYYYDLGDDPTETYSAVLFGRQFNNQISLATHNMCMMYKGFTAEYDPTANYDMKEAHYSGSKAGDVTSSGTSTGSTSTTTAEATIDGDTKTTSTVTSSPTSSMSSTTSLGTPSQTVAWGEGESTTENFNTISKEETRRTGNIGVSTVPDMLMKETEIRFINYLYTVVDRIINDLTVLIYTGD